MPFEGWRYSVIFYIGKRFMRAPKEVRHKLRGLAFRFVDSAVRDEDKVEDAQKSNDTDRPCDDPSTTGHSCAVQCALPLDLEDEIQVRGFHDARYQATMPICTAKHNNRWNNRIGIDL